MNARTNSTPQRLPRASAIAAPGRNASDRASASLPSPYSSAEPLGFPEFDVDNYYVIQELGKGSYGVVVEAEDETTGETVAIKIVSKVRPHKSPAQVAKLVRRECEMILALQEVSDRIVKLFGIFEDHQNVYLVTEKLNGGTVQEMLNKGGGKLCEDEARRVVADALRFLADCHGSGMVYSDVKPANFMLSRDFITGKFEVKAVDLGCTQMLPAGQTLPVRRGTPLLMAPEAYMASLCHKSDLWSLGIMLYIMLTGNNPWFDGINGLTPDDVMMRVLHDEVKYVEEDWEGVSREARNLVERLLVRLPNGRLSAEEALEHPWLSSENKQRFLP